MPDPPEKFRLIPLPAVPDVGEAREPCVGTAFENVSVNVPVSDKYDVSEAFVTVSVHVPTTRADTTPAVREQFAVPLDTDEVTEPVPDPPRIDKMMPVYKSPFVVATDRAA